MQKTRRNDTEISSEHGSRGRDGARRQVERPAWVPAVRRAALPGEPRQGAVAADGAGPRSSMACP